MKISAIQNSNSRNIKPLFKAGVTEFFSDFDGTFMPHQYRHDVFCNDLPNSPRRDFLKSGKKDFQDYFKSFGELLGKLGGAEGKKLNFTITSGRNRPEYNYYMTRIRQDGLSVPIPDQLVIRNGGEIYFKREGAEDFFKSDTKEMFLKSDFSKSKREAVKEATNGWDGDKIREIITNYLKTISPVNGSAKTTEVTRLFTIIAPTVEYDGSENILKLMSSEYDKLLFSDMKESEIVLHIKELAKKYKEDQTAGLTEAEAKRTIKEIDETIHDIAYNMTKIRKNACVIFEADTDGAFYGEGMHFNAKRKMMKPVPKNYAALKDNGNLEFHINLPYAISDEGGLKVIKDDLDDVLRKSGIKFISKTHHAKNEDRFGEVIIKPSVGDKKISKLFDTKAQVEKIIKGKLNDLVVVAGDDTNDARMLDFFEYIDLEEKGEEIIGEKNLRKIYDLPLISIYVDNSAIKTGDKDISSSLARRSLEDLEYYFNSDGNVRFIRVIPENTVGRPQTLQEGLQIAIKEYSKRNPEFEKNLSPEMREMIKEINIDYPIDKKFTEELEKKLGAKLWNPVHIQETIEEIGTNGPNHFKKKYLAIIGCAVAGLAGIFALIKNKKAKKADEKGIDKVKNK